MYCMFGKLTAEMPNFSLYNLTHCLTMCSLFICSSVFSEQHYDMHSCKIKHLRHIIPTF